MEDSSSSDDWRAIRRDLPRYHALVPGEVFLAARAAGWMPRSRDEELLADLAVAALDGEEALVRAEGEYAKWYRSGMFRMPLDRPPNRRELMHLASEVAWDTQEWLDRQ